MPDGEKELKDKTNSEVSAVEPPQMFKNRRTYDNDDNVQHGFDTSRNIMRSFARCFPLVLLLMLLFTYQSR